MDYLKKLHPQKSKREKWLQDEHNRTFITWIRKMVEDNLGSPNQISRELEWIAHGPSHEVLKVPGYITNGV